MDSKITRRTVLAGLGGLGAGFGLGGLSHFFPLPSPQVWPDWSPGAEGFVASTCLLCPAHCGIVGRLVDGALVGIRGNPLHPISRGGLCPKGVAGLQLLYHPARLRGPRVRTSPEPSNSFRPASWKEALALVGDRVSPLLSAKRGASTAWIVGQVDGVMSELVTRFARACGSPHVIRDDYADGSEQVMSLDHGISSRPAFDLDRADLVLSFGVPLSEAWWSLPQAARARDLPPERRRRWFQVDTRLSRTASASDEWFPVRPGAYGALALAIAYVLLKEGLYDDDWIRTGVSGFAEYRALVLRHGEPESLAPTIGLSVDAIVRLAKEFGRAHRPLALWDQVVSWRQGGLADALAIHALNILTGSIARPGGVFVQQALPVPSLDDLARTKISPPSQTPLSSGDWAEQILEGPASPIDVLFVYQANPVASAPNPETVREALKRVPLVVSFSPFLDETARCAHLVLPDSTYLERWQDAPAPACVPSPVWGVVQPVVPPLYDTRATGDVILGLAALLGGEIGAALPWASVEEIVRRRGQALAKAQRGSAFVAGFRRDELRELETRGYFIPHGLDEAHFWEMVKNAGGWFDPYFDEQARAAASKLANRKVALFPDKARDDIAAKLVAPPSDPSYPLWLAPYRVMTLASGGTPLVPWLLEDLGIQTGDAWEVWAELNPKTGRELGLSSGQKVRVRSAHGSFVARLRLFEGAQPGVVNVPYGLHTSAGSEWPFEPANPLHAVGPGRDPQTGLPDWYSTRVRLEPV